MDYEIGINENKIIKTSYSLSINGKIVRTNIPTIEETLKEIKKWLRIRFEEPLK